MRFALKGKSFIHFQSHQDHLVLLLEAIFFIERREDAFACRDQMDADDAPGLHIRKAPFQKHLCDASALICRIHGKIIDLKGPAVMEEQGCINPIILTHFLSNYRQNQNPYTSMPSTAEMPMSMTGDRPFFFIFAGIK